MLFIVENVPLPTFFVIGKIIAMVYMFLTFIGWIGNGLIVLVTVRSKHLHGSCNILIAMQAFSDIILQMAHVPFFYFAFNNELVTFFTCWKINFFFVSAMDFSNWLIFFIALDRLLAAKYPPIYKSLNQAYYLGGIVAFCTVYCISFKFITYMSLSDEETLCLIAQSVTGITEHIWLGCQTLVNCGVVAVYCALSKVIKNVSKSEYQKITRSLNTMILVNLFGWFLTLLGCTVVFFLSPNTRVFVSFEMPLGIFANINLGAPFFIYYSRSTLYRKEFQKLLGIERSRVAATTSAMSTGFQSSSL